MSVSNNERKNKSKKQYFATTTNDTSTEQTPKSFDEPIKDGDEASNSNPQEKGYGRPKLERSQNKESVMIFLTKEQKDELRHRAEKANLSMSKYVMLKIFGLNI